MFDLYYHLIGCPFVVIVDGEIIAESKIFQFTKIVRGADDSIIVQAVIGEDLKTYPLNCIRIKANGLLFKIQEIKYDT